MSDGSGGSLTGRPRLTLTEIVLDASDARDLAEFYQRLLGGTIASDEPGWVTLRDTGAGLTLAFASEPTYSAPVWPSRREDQQMMLHLDFRADDLEQAAAHAVAAGAELASFQPQADVRVMIDPAGHPFCLWVEPSATTDVVGEGVGDERDDVRDLGLSGDSGEDPPV